MPSKQAKQHSNEPQFAEHKGILVRAPAISFPKSVEAIHCVGEKFDANPVETGAGSMSVPIATSPDRGGFGRQLVLLFDSGSGTGSFGLGWILSPPAITRKHDKILPQYRDTEESNVLILSGSADLVPVLVEHDGSWQRDPFDSSDSVAGYRIDRYRPRVEGHFARIERWTKLASGHTHWRSISKDNHTTPYGKRAGARITDRADPMHAVSWLSSERYDNTGNLILYQYKVKVSAGVVR